MRILEHFKEHSNSIDSDAKLGIVVVIQYPQTVSIDKRSHVNLTEELFGLLRMFYYMRRNLIFGLRHAADFYYSYLANSTLIKSNEISSSSMSGNTEVFSD